MSKHKNKPIIAKTGITLNPIEPLTSTQHSVFESTKHMLLRGMAGTGKTFISMYLALKDIEIGEYEKVIIVRSAVPTRDVGFLPGTLKDKNAVYEDPYRGIANELCRRGDAYDILSRHEVVAFMTTSYIRGVTLDNCVVIVDECQNMSFHELDSIITRMGDNSRLVFCGDFEQSDFTSESKTGLKRFIDIITRTGDFDIFNFEIEDIVRSGFVKRYIMSKYEWIE